MIIAADIGNTNIKIGLFDKDRLVKSWRISTDVHRTSDEHGSILKQLFFAAGILEGGFRQMIASTPGRFGVALLTGAWWLFYFGRCGRGGDDDRLR